MSHFGLVGSLEKSTQYEWNIPNYFSLSATKGSCYTSPSFVFANASWHLSIYPGGNAEAKSGYLSLYLENETKRPRHASVTLGIRKDNGTLMGETGSGRIAECAGYNNICNTSFLQQNASQLVPSGILTVICNLKLNEEESNDTIKEKKGNLQTFRELDELSENFKNLFQNKESCDTTLHVVDKEYKVHKIVLMARSSVFAAMFLHETSEKHTGIVNIPDCYPESFEEFLEFLYSGKLEKPSLRSALYLYQTSEKYNVQNLKTFCSGFLMQNLTLEYLCDILIMADKYDDTKLFSEAQCFFNNNLSEVFATSEWNDLLNNNRRLANKLLMEMSSKVKVVK